MQWDIPDLEQAITNTIPNSSMDKGGAASVRVWQNNLVLSTELLKLTFPVLALLSMMPLWQ